MIAAIAKEYKISNADITFREDCNVDQLIDVIEGNVRDSEKQPPADHAPGLLPMAKPPPRRSNSAAARRHRRAHRCAQDPADREYRTFRDKSPKIF